MFVRNDAITRSSSQRNGRQAPPVRYRAIRLKASRMVRSLVSFLVAPRQRTNRDVQSPHSRQTSRAQARATP